MRTFIDTIRESAAGAERIHTARRDGFNTQTILYHGTDATFDSFDRAFSRTAAHIYLSPDPATSAYYGATILECVIRGRLADLTHDGDQRLIRRLAEEFTDEFTDTVRSDAGLADMAEQMAVRIAANDPDLTHQEAIWEAEETPEYIAAARQAAFQYAVEFLQSGQLYNRDFSGRFQDRVLDTVFDYGYDAVRFIDASHSGEPLSVVVRDAAHVRIVGIFDPSAH